MEKDDQDAPQDFALVVDDNEDISEPLAMLLRHNGYQAETASSGAEALRKWESGTFFCVIISDIGMPGMNGYELAHALRGLPGCKKTVMIALTGMQVFGDRARALQAGFDDLVIKPAGPHSLIALIERLRKQKR